MKKVLLAVTCFSLIYATLATAGCGGLEKTIDESKAKVSIPQESNLKTKKDVLINSNKQSDEASLIWKWDIGISGSITSKIIFNNSKAFFGTNSNTLYCCSIEPKFENIWQYETHIGIYSPPVVANGKIYFKSDEDKLCCLDEIAGTKLWDYETDGKIVSLPEISNNKVFFVSLVAQHGVLLCLDAECGKIYWEIKASEMFTNITAVNGKVYFGTGNYKAEKGEFCCLNQDNGEKEWGFRTDGIIQEKPVIINNKVFFSFKDKNSRTLLYCLNADNGNKLWELNDISSESLTIYNDKLYTGFRCFNAEKGEIIWEFKSNKQPDYFLSPLIVSKGRVFLRTGLEYGGDFEAPYGRLYCLDAESGKKNWEFFNNQDDFYTDFAYSNGKIIFGNKNGYLFCLDETNGKKIWQKHYIIGRIKSVLTVSSNRVVIDLNDYSKNINLICVNAETGEKISELEEIGYICTSPAISNDKVYFGLQLTTNSILHCLDARNGKNIWELKMNGRISRNITIFDDKMYFVENHSNKGILHCLNTINGESIFEIELPGEMHTTPTVSNNKIFFGGPGLMFYCMNANNGEMIWKFDALSSIIKPAVVADNKVFFGSNSIGFYCLDADTGTEIWKHETKNNFSKPTYSNGKVYFGSEFYDYSLLYCVKADTGEKIWEYKTKGVIENDPVLSYGIICILSNKIIDSHEGKLFCLEANSGKKIWEYPTGMESTSSPKILNNKIYFAYGKELICFEAQSGKIIFRNIITSEIEFSPAIANGRVYVGSDDGRLYCFGDAE